MRGREIRLLIERLESRCLLDGSGFPGNDCPPDLDLSAIPEQVVHVGQTLTFDLLNTGATATDTDADQQATGDPISFQLDPDVPEDTPTSAEMTSDGLFTWTPSAGQVGTHTLMVIVTDQGTPVLADVETMTVVVTENLAPVVDLNGPAPGLDFTTTFTEGDGPLSATADDLAITDSNDASLTSARVKITNRRDGSLETLAVETNVTSISADFDEISGELRLTGTDSVEHYQQVLRTLRYDHASQSPTAGARVLEVFVNDGNSDSIAALSTVTVMPVNDAPDSAPIASQQVLEGQLLEVTVTASDPEGDGLTFQFDPQSNPPLGATIEKISDTSAVIRWTPQASDGPGPFPVRVMVTDDGAPAQSVVEEFSVTVVPVNDPPDLAPIGDQQVLESQLLEVTITASDPEGDGLTFQFDPQSNPPLGATIETTSATSAVIRWTPQASDGPGPFPVRVMVTDDGTPAQSVLEEFSVIVVPVNDPPDLTPIEDQQVLEGQLLEVTVTASDPEDDGLTFQFDPQSNPPLGATIETTSATSAVIRWTPQASDGPGPFPVRVMVTDDGTPAQSVVEEFSVIVVPVNDPPDLAPIEDRLVSVSQLLEVTVTASDPEGDGLTFQFDLQSDSPAGATIEKTSETSAVVRWTPMLADGPGPFSFRVVVTDDGSPAQRDVEEYHVTLALETVAATDLTISGNSLPPYQGSPDSGFGEIAPEFATLNPQGEPVSVIHDGTTKLVGFFAHWCLHCQAEIPQVVDWLSQNSLPANVEIVAVSTAVNTASDNFPPSDWFAREAWPLDVFVDTASGDIVSAYGISGFPFWVLVDGDGKVFVRRAGELTETQFSDLVELAVNPEGTS